MEAFKQQWYNSSIAQSLKASKNGRVYFVPSYLCLGLPSPIGAELFLNQVRQKLLSKGLPYKKISKIFFLWSGHPCPPTSRTGKDACSTIWRIKFLEVPKT
ncbi:hypothetical protein DSM106972_026350 [Dulcicalothrix desertica PCC 7102]|uniref:Uncharacterized protein n=1 Tax=Dulcicalothrix desertica PCC 7102 TaxID=232991 RepID=A0A3S1CQM2_9CYAN|nr:hypothetical protein [Dulcicalothrix desertica]RUT07374.1 hypothetical protein DSM106972_026350 [Dulcicalothrix desertica PCC 7102]